MDTPQKHVCGVCGDEWLTEDEYNNHICPNTNFAPTQAEHLINSTTPDFATISQAAIERGAQDADNTIAPEVTDNSDTPTEPIVTLQ